MGEGGVGLAVPPPQADGPAGCHCPVGGGQGHQVMAADLAGEAAAVPAACREAVPG